jgi:O-antigen ligase
LCVLAAVLASAIVYPLRLPTLTVAQLDALADTHRASWGNLYFGQVRSIIAFNHSPLVLKECLSSAILIASLCFLLLYIFRTISIQYIEKAQGAEPDPALIPPPRRWLTDPLLWGGLFLIYAAVSAIYLSPTPHTSLWTLLMCSLGFGAFAALVVVRTSWHVIRKFMVAITLAGVLVAFVSFLQHIEAAWWFLPKFDDPRNRVGSLIGHNTGLSAYLLFPLSFALAFWFLARRRVTRAAIALAIVLILFVLVAAQSRAIWPIAAVMVIAECWILQKAQGGRRSTRTVVLVIVALVLALAALQSVAPSINPLARHSVRLSERLQRDLSPRQLVKETRLRIFVVSIPLILKSPLVGHGLGSFQYVYPPAHGEYFGLHPDSVLGTTVRRTDVAHNDYLQLVVETGLVGAMLLAAAVATVLRRIRGAFRRMQWNSEKMLFTALLCPLAGIAVHAALDFPFHVHPIAITAVVTLALAYSAAMRGEETVDAGSASSNRGAPETPLSAGRSGPATRPSSNIGFKSAFFLSLIAVASGWLASPLGFELILREYISDTLARDATNWVATARAVANQPGFAKYQALDSAKELYRRAIKVNVFNGSAMEGMASACLLAGTLDYTEWRNLTAAKVQARAVEAMRKSAVRSLGSAISYAKLAAERGELRYHYIYYVMGQANHLLARLETAQAQNYLQEARKAFEQAVALNNAEVASLQELAEVYEELPQPDRVRAQALRRRIFAVDPEYAENRYLAPVEDAAARGRFADAWRSLNSLSEAVGDHWAVLFAKAQLYLKEALWPPPQLDIAPESPEARNWFKSRYDLATSIANDLAPRLADNPAFERFKLRLLAAGGETTAALELADRLITAARIPDPELDVLRYELALRAGQHRALRWVKEGDAEFWYYRQRLRVLLLGPVALGSGQLAGFVRNAPKFALRIDEGLRAGAYLAAAGQWDLVLAIADNLARNYPNDPDVQRLREQALANTRQNKDR